LFLFSSATFYYWVSKKRKQFFIFLTLAILTHWCFVFIAIFYAIYDIKRRDILWYAIPFVLIAIWLSFCMLQHSGPFSYSTARPSFKYILSPFEEVFGFLFHGLPWLFGAIMGILYLILFIIGCCFARREIKIAGFSCLFFWVCIFVFSWVYPMSIYLPRYFTVIFPQIIIITGFGLYKILIFVYNKIGGARIKW